MLKRKSILITGCAGLIGSNLCDYVRRYYPEFHIVGIDDLSDGYEDNIHPEVDFYQRDAGSDLSDLFENYTIDYVFHFAARAAESMSGFNRRFFHTNNIVNSANIINYCIEYNVKRLVFASSMSVYGNNIVPFTEYQQPNPIDPYGIGKLAVELDLQAAFLQHGLEYCIFRGHSIYGPKQSLWDKYRNVIGIWMRQTLDGDPITIYGDGNQTRAFTYIDDIIPQIWEMATTDQCKNQIYNIGNSNVVRLIDLYKMLSEVTGYDNCVYLDAIHESPHAYCDHAKSDDHLTKWTDTSLKDGLGKMWEWAKVQPKREIKTWNQFEIKKGLYDMWK